jgi:hypothetical protein
MTSTPTNIAAESSDALTGLNISAISQPAMTDAPPTSRLRPSRRRYDLTALNVDPPWLSRSSSPIAAFAVLQRPLKLPLQ